VDTQGWINLVMLIGGGLGGWILNNLKKDIDSLTTKLQQVEILVAGTYVKRDDMDKLGKAIFDKLDRMDERQGARLDRIETKLESKQDKAK
jgi:hypothetical protein